MDGWRSKIDWSLDRWTNNRYKIEKVFMTDCQSTFNRSMIDETAIGYMEDEEHNDQDTCMMMIWWFRNYHNYLLGGVKFMFSSLLVCRSVSLPLSSPSLCLSPSVPSSLRPPPSMFPPAIVCRNSLKVSDKYDRDADNASVGLRYNDPSGATAFTSLLLKKKIAAVPMILILFRNQQCNSLVDSRNSIIEI